MLPINAAVADEIGDLMFALVNLARHLDIDADTSLRGTNAKFERRFAAIEAALARIGKTPSEATLAEMDALWDQAKDDERAGLERFRAKWVPVRVKKTRQNNNLESRRSGYRRHLVETRPHLTGLGRIGPHADGDLAVVQNGFLDHFRVAVKP